MNKAIVLLVVGWMGLCASATTNWIWTGKGDGVHWSDGANWNFGTPPVSNETDTVVSFVGSDVAGSPSAFDTVNDLEKAYLNGLSFSKNISACRISGNPIHAGSLADSVEIAQPFTLTMDVDFYACKRNADNNVTTTDRPSHILIWNGLVTHEWDRQDARVVKSGSAYDPAIASGVRLQFTGAATNVFNGRYLAMGRNSNYNYSNYHDKFTGGTAIFNCDVSSCWFEYKSKAHVIFNRGASYMSYDANFSDFYQECTLDIACPYTVDGACLGQAAGTAVINVLAGGDLDTTASGFRSGNNKPTEFNIFDGGQMTWRSSYGLSENGVGRLNLYGGRLFCGTDGCDYFRIGYGSANTAARVSENILNLAGGELVATSIYDTSNAAPAAEKDIFVYLDGGQLTFYNSTTTAFVYGSSLGDLKDHLKVFLRPGGLAVKVGAGKSVTWNKKVLVEDGVTPGTFALVGGGTLKVADDLTQVPLFDVVDGTLSVDDPANFTQAVKIEKGAKLSFTGTTLALSALESQNGTVVLTSGQSLALASAPTVADGDALVFDLKAAGTDGVYTLVTLTDGTFPDGFAAKCALLTPTSGKSCVFAADGATLTATVASGTAPTPAAELYDLTPAGDGFEHIAANETKNVAEIAEDDAYAMKAGSTLNYTGAADATLAAPQHVGAVTVSRGSGSGDLTVKGPATAVTGEAAQAGRMTFAGTDDGEIVLSGDWNMPSQSAFQLNGGKFRFASDFDFRTQNGGVEYYSPKEKAMTLVMDEGAQMIATTLAMGGDTRDVSDAAADALGVSAVQKGGTMMFKNSGSLTMGRLPTWAPTSYTLESGVFTMHPKDAIYNSYGRTKFAVKGGVATVPRYVFGTSGGAAALVNDLGGRGELEVSGGELTVEEQFDWIASKDTDRRTKVSLTGGRTTIPATTNTCSTAGAHHGYAMLGIDGGELALSGKAPVGDSDVDDYLKGLSELTVGANGATFDARCDATILQQLNAATTNAGDLVKTGPGALAFAATNNVVRGAIDVREGTLKASIAEGAVTAMPEGLLMYWDFDGEGDECLRDKTGSGYDLVQVHRYSPTADVVFTEENAHRGKSAKWSGARESLAMSNLTEIVIREFTVSMWFRIVKYAGDFSWPMFFSNRSKVDFSGNDSGFEIGYKTSAVFGSGNTDSGIVMGYPTYMSMPESLTGPIPLDEWHMCTMTCGPNGARVYYDGQYVTNNTASEVSSYRLLGNSYMITIGQGIAASEFLRNGDYLDDIAVFARQLSDEDVAALYAVQSVPGVKPVTRAVKVAAGATWDMNGCRHETKTLAAVGAVSNGVLTVGEKIVVDTKADAVAYVEHPTFAAGGVIDLGRTAQDPLKRKNSPVPVMAFTTLSDEDEAAIREWTVVNAGNPDLGEPRVVVDRTAGMIYAELPKPGLMLFVR